MIILSRPKSEDGEADVSQLAKACKLIIGEPVDYETLQTAFKKVCKPGKASFGVDDLAKVPIVIVL